MNNLDTLRYNEEKQRYEIKKGDEWVLTKATRTRDVDLYRSSTKPTLLTNPGLTSYTDWNAEPETSPVTPKSLAEQTAKSRKGRAMQEYAGIVRDQVNDLTERGFEVVGDAGFEIKSLARFKEEEGEEMNGDEKSSRENIASYFAAGKMKCNADGSITIGEEITIKELKAMKDSLLDLKLDTDPEKREAMLAGINGLVSKVDQAIAKREVAEAPDGAVKLLDQLKVLQIQVQKTREEIRAARAIKNKRMREALLDKLFSDLRDLNKKQIHVALVLLDKFEKLRDNNPDRMVEFINELPDKSQRNRYKTALINFVQTHNSFGFSAEIESSLTFTADRDEKYAYKRNGKPSFTQALLAAYAAPKKEDDHYTFTLQTTKIPEDKFREIVEEELRQN